MSPRKPLMPKATAVWLVENTSLSFDQIAEFCGLHGLEVKGIADGDVAHGIKGMDPISNGQLSREEIKRAEEDHERRLTLAESKVDIPEVKTKPGPRYTPVSRRQDRPNAVVWLLRNHPEFKDSQIMRLVGTTKPTIASIRDRTHWNSHNLTPQDPVTLGLCSQTDLDNEVQGGAPARAREEGAGQEAGEGRHAAADRGDHLRRVWVRSPPWRSWPPKWLRQRPRRPRPSSRRASLPSCAKWAAPRRTSSPTSATCHPGLSTAQSREAGAPKVRCLALGTGYSLARIPG